MKIMNCGSKIVLQNSVIDDLAFFFRKKSSKYAIFIIFHLQLYRTIISNDANLGQSIVVDHGRNRNEPVGVFPSWNLE